MPQALKPIIDGNILISTVANVTEGTKTFRSDAILPSSVEVNQDKVKVSRSLLRKMRSKGIYKKVKNRIIKK